jgi:hypothetical protein
MQAFRLIPSAFHGSPGEYYGVLSNPLHLAKTTIYVTQTILGDSVIVRSPLKTSIAVLTSAVQLWRCFIVYDRNWYIAIPNALILIANACKSRTSYSVECKADKYPGTGYIAVWYLSQATPGSNIFDHPGANLITVFFVLTMLTSVTCTGTSPPFDLSIYSLTQPLRQL